VSERRYPALGRTARCRRATVSTLWFNTSGAASMINCNDAASPLRSLVRTSTFVSGERSRMARIVAAIARLPVGEVVAGHARDDRVGQFQAHDGFGDSLGSLGSRANGLRVSIRQKPHARVHRSPFTMNVAVPADQHSKIFGQPASSQTVTSRRSSVRVRNDWYSSPMCASMRNHSGLRLWIGTPASGSTPALRSRRNSVARHSPTPRFVRRAPPWPLPEASFQLDAESLVDVQRAHVEPERPHRGDGLVRDAAGTMALKPSMSMSTFNATPCNVRRRPRSLRSVRTPTAAILAGTPSTSAHTPDSRPTGRPVQVGPRVEVTNGRDDGVLESSDVYLAGRGVVGDGDDRPGHDLTGCVIRDVPPRRRRSPRP